MALQTLQPGSFRFKLKLSRSTKPQAECLKRPLKVLGMASHCLRGDLILIRPIFFAFDFFFAFRLCKIRLNQLYALYFMVRMSIMAGLRRIYV